MTDQDDLQRIGIPDNPIAETVDDYTLAKIEQRARDRAKLKAERREARKLQERLNRIKKLTPGNTRIWKLDEVAKELQYTLDFDETIDPEQRPRLEELILFVKRLEWDLVALNETVHDKTRGKLSKHDPNHWRGPRP